MFEDQLCDLSLVCFSEFGKQAIYDKKKVVTVIVDESVERVSPYGEVRVNAYEISFQKTEIEHVEEGVLVEVGNRIYRLDSFVDSDSSLTIMSANLEQS